MASLKYELFDANLRKSIDLRNWKTEIVDGVKSVLSSASVNVHKDYYEITVFVNPTDGELRTIGKGIASNPDIGQYVMSHYYGDDNEKSSGKLFERMK